MAAVYLSLGSNVEREKHIRSCIATLKNHFGDVLCSPVYESESVGFAGSHFYNLVARIETVLPLSELNNLLKKIEDQHGRNRSGPKFSPRTLDIDILTYGDLTGCVEGIDLPREEISKNAFVLLPMADIAPDVLHPVLLQTYAALWAAYDKSKQKLWQVEFPL
jgi:2-amino-4-hydroxy-6-hydroxymethyldihydropteridine diphosphokinase